MAVDPELRMYTVYEWVVEQVEGPADDREIVECCYFDEADRAVAEAHAAQVIADGDEVDFGLCRKRGSDADGEDDRTYAYRAADGTWPAEFEDGRAIPKRFNLGNT